MTYRSPLALGAAAVTALILSLGTAQAQPHAHGWNMGDWPAFDSIEGAGEGALDADAFRALIEARIDARRTAGAESRSGARTAMQAERLDALVAHVMDGAEDGRVDADALRNRLESWTQTQRAEWAEGMATRRAARDLMHAEMGAETGQRIRPQSAQRGERAQKMDRGQMDRGRMEGSRMGRQHAQGHEGHGQQMGSRADAAPADRVVQRAFRFFDGDRDGTISEAEYDAAIARLTEWADRRGQLR